MKIIANLNGFESEALFDILHHEIIKFTVESKLELLAGDIDESRHKWNVQHGKFLEKIKNKLLAEHHKKVDRDLKRQKKSWSKLDKTAFTYVPPIVSQ